MKFFLRILSSMLACALLPCIVMYAVSNYMFGNQYQQTVNRAQARRIQAVENATEILIDNFEQHAMRIAMDADCKAISSYTKLGNSVRDKDFLANMMRIINLLNDTVLSIKMIDSVYLYVADSDYIVSPRSGAVALDSMTDIGWLEKYNGLREGNSPGRFIPAHVITTRPAEENRFYGRRYVSFVYPIHYVSVFEGALVINLYEDDILTLLNSGDPESSIALFSGDGTLITGSGALDYAAVLQEYGAETVFAPQSAETGYFNVDIDGEQYLCTWSKAADGGHVFVSMDNMSSLMREKDRYQLAGFSIVLFLVLVAAVIAFYASQRLYSPVEKLVRELKSNGMDLSERDEMSAISRAVNELLTREKQLFSGHRDEKIREATMMRLLSGEAAQTDDDAKKVLPYSRNVCMLAAFDPHEAPRNDEVFDSRVRLFIQVIREEFAGSDEVEVTAMRHSPGVIAAIVSAGEAADDLEAFLKARLAALQALSGDVLGRVATFAVGSLQDDLVGVWESLGQARNALEYRYFYGGGSLLFYDTVCVDTQSYDASARIGAICHSMRAGQKEDAIKEIDALAADIERQGHVCVVSVSQILNLLATELIRFAEESDIKLEDVFKNGVSIYQRLWDQPYFNDACAWLKSAFAAVIDYQNAVLYVGSEQIRKVLEYTKAHYVEGITIDDIASYIGLSYSYLRKIFKDATGRSLADYINELRIKKARQLLLETSLTVREIAAQCGYTHERSFSRAFTQAESVSPGKYKEMFGRRHENGGVTY